MKNPEKTKFNEKYFKGMKYPKFVEYWEKHKFMGDPRKYYTGITGLKVPKLKEEKK